MMHEAAIKEYFEGLLPAERLRDDIDGSLQTETEISGIRIHDMDTSFPISTEHLIRLCDAVIGEALRPEHLAIVGFCVVASDLFEYDTDSEDGARVAEAVIDWADYRTNYRLTVDTTRKFRNRLLTGEDTFAEDDHFLNRHGMPENGKERESS